MSTPVRIGVEDPDLIVGVVEVHGASCGPTPPALAAQIDAAVASHAGAEWPTESVRAAVRDLLRRGGYKPTGRGKPASEFLAQAASRGEFPRVQSAVDALNLVSYETGLPISLLDADRAAPGGAGLVLRLGRDGESYVFNASGHTIDVAGLLSVCREDGAPCGNPVKDSMETKLVPASTHLLAVIWGTRRLVDEAAMRAVAERLGRLLTEHCGARAADVRVLT